jgi:hypothetical protein
MSDPHFDVVAPVGRASTTELPPAPALDDLTGKRIAFVWIGNFSGDVMMEVISARLSEKYEGLEFVPHETYGDIHGFDEDRVVAELPGKIKETQVDAAVVAVGACGSCTPAVMRALLEIEALGVPSVALLAEGFLKQGQAIARANGLMRPRFATYPGVIVADDDATVRDKSATFLYPMVEAGLLGLPQALPARKNAVAARSLRDTVFSGSLEDVQEFFVSQQWSDGLPVVPPTRELVERMLEHTPLDKDTALGVLPPESREVTVWDVAVNGVMAGCRPEHLPILIAATEAIADPAFHLRDAGATPGWEPLVVVSGPDLDSLGLHHGQGAMKAFNRANSTIGRYLRLAFINLAGLRTAPGDTDKGCIGMNFNVALAEDSPSTVDLGWQTLREELGYQREDTVVAVQSVVGSSLPIYSGGADPEPHLQMLAEHIAGTEGHWSFMGVWYHQWTPLLVMSPGVAQVFTRAGMSKRDVIEELARRSTSTAGRWQRYTPMVGFSWDDAIANGTAPWYAGMDPDASVPTITYPDRMAIVLAGDPARNQSRYLVNNHEHGPRTARRAQLG